VQPKLVLLVGNSVFEQLSLCEQQGKIMDQPKKVAVLGGGSFGTAIANFTSGNGHEVFQCFSVDA